MIINCKISSHTALLLTLLIVQSGNCQTDPSIKTQTFGPRQATKPDFSFEDPFFGNVSGAPVIGILTMPCPKVDFINHTSIVPASYVKWLESAGAIVVPVPYTLPVSQLDYFFKNLDGIVFTGGRALLFTEELQQQKLNQNTQHGVGNLDQSINDVGVSIMDMDAKNAPEKKRKLTRFARAIKFFMEKAQQATETGDYFPVFGICLGMEGMVLTLENDLNNLKYLMKMNLQGRDYIEGIGIPTEFAKSSRLYKAFGPQIDVLSNRVFFYHHQVGIHYENFIKDHHGKIKPLSWFKDDSETFYLTSFEFIDAPIFGVQYHPEKAAYEWRVKTNRDVNAILSSFNLAFGFVLECKKSPHKFDLGTLPILSVFHFEKSDQSSIYNEVYLIPDSYHPSLKLFGGKLTPKDILNYSSMKAKLGFANTKTIPKKLTTDSKYPFVGLEVKKVASNFEKSKSKIDNKKISKKVGQTQSKGQTQRKGQTQSKSRTNHKKVKKRVKKTQSDL